MSEDATIKFQFHDETWTLEYRDSDHSYWLSSEIGGKHRAVACSTLAKVNYSDPSGLMNYARKHALAGRDHKEETKFTQECGSAAHAQLEALAKTGEPLDLKDQPKRVRGALQAVAKWYFAEKPEFAAAEVFVAHPAHRFAGRFDFLATVKGELVLADLKTTDKDWGHFRKFKAEAAYAQMAGYVLGFGATYPDSPQPVARYVLHVNTSGTYDWKRDLAPDESTASFLSKIRCYRDAQNWSKVYEELRKAVLAA